jgi:hypothetical protein
VASWQNLASYINNLACSTLRHIKPGISKQEN